MIAKSSSAKQAPVKVPAGTSRQVRYKQINLSRKESVCPKCRTVSKRHSEGRRRLREVGVSYPVVLEVTYSKHYCPKCRKHFSQPMEHIALPSGRFTNRVRRTALDLVLRRSMTLEKATHRMSQMYHVHVPPTTLHDWVVAECNE